MDSGKYPGISVKHFDKIELKGYKQGRILQCILPLILKVKFKTLRVIDLLG